MSIRIYTLAKTAISWWKGEGRSSWKALGRFGSAGLIALTLILFIGTVHGQASGIAIFKETATHSDGSAKVFEYASVKSMGQVNVYTTPEGKEIRLTLFQPQSRVSYPDFMSRSITAPDQLGPIQKGLQSYRDTIARHPRTGQFLTRYVEAAEEIVRRVNGGQILFNGRWMTESEHKALVMREEAVAKEFNDRRFQTSSA